MDIKNVLQKNNFRFEKKFGQNFISDDALLKKIADGANLGCDLSVLEIGCGAGTLTRVLAERAKFVLGYEIDYKLKPVLSENLVGFSNCEIVFKDVMKEDVSDIEAALGGDYQVVANLPYYITTPIIMKFVNCSSTKCLSLVCMVQEEVADRLSARAGEKDYAAITVAVNAVADTEKLFSVSRNNFYPVPNVDSAVIKITFNRDKFTVRDKDTFRNCVRAAFSSRRKTLVNNLINGFSFSRAEAEELLLTNGIPLSARGETLSYIEFFKLSNSIFEKRLKNS